MTSSPASSNFFKAEFSSPDFLVPGDLVAIIATARFVSQEDLNEANSCLDRWGFRVIFGQSIGVKHHQLAGSDTARAQDLQWALDHPEVKAIWCARGGYGTIRILDRVNFEGFKQYPKWIIGYSDVTALHARIQKLGWASLHAQMPLALGEKTAETSRTIEQALKGINYIIEWPIQVTQIYKDDGSQGAKSTNDQTVIMRPGEVTAPVIGGNLSLIYSLQGSEEALITRGKILFIEDLDEYLYHIDRMMYSLKRSGMLNGLAGLIVGGMSDMKDHEIPFGYDPYQIIWAAVAEETYPVVFDAPMGHLKDNRALPLGRLCALRVTPTEAKIQVHGKTQ
ncbi:LD-carboxypeptidase [Flavobacteriaceae bacterium]|nr:LD-carboxypeptidase [Flavobacteriaceae bacterium]